MRIAPVALLLITSLLWVSAKSHAAADTQDRVLYRYTDDQGILVINDAIPPKFVANGYEILALTGRVVEVVAPQLSPAEYEAQRQLEVQQDADRKLLKRYNSIADIESARSRKLAIVEQDMAIMRSNVGSLRRQIAQEEASAARTQRGGREVAPELLQRIVDLKTEVTVLQERLSQRVAESDAIGTDFDKAAARYTELGAGD
ncbi:hypothetical protein MO867_00745 [Microbulbifer sp. OS29]|uniref:DUF4124 domain-containing protein n=1 Tax=Microbulbifer okhotskensis TaxID=2926617 RepID=A0A9X2ENJ2_9GAMM|nr:hypothetical protein [Microbulbifer okhotskensis]MCO1332853.1 hypothetical protein [Microbulbifer okhotskensis]